MAAANMTAHATEQPSVASDSSLTATEYAISHNAGGSVDVITSMPITKQLLANLLQSNSHSMPGQTIGSASSLIGGDMNISTMADAEMTMYATEQPTVATDSSRTATEHATSHNAAEQSVEAEEVIWQVKFKSWRDLPQEASAMIEAAYKEGRPDTGIYHQHRSKTQVVPYCIDFTAMTQTNMVSRRRRAARRHIRAIDWQPREVTTEPSGVWREAIEDTKQHQRDKGNKFKRQA